MPQNSRPASSEPRAKRQVSPDSSWLGFVLIQSGKLTPEALDCLERAKDLHPSARVLLDRLSAASGESDALQARR
jgi:hypothetical protein